MRRPARYTLLTDQEWDEKIAALERCASSCELCPRQCRVDRLKNERGFCGAPGGLVVSSIFPHHGEEPPISGSGGSGTVFFTYCTLQCIFCQNYQLSHLAEGRTYTVPELAEKMIGLQTAGCHNVNLVTATHFLPWILKALHEASRHGLEIPVVYNCGGYERVPILRLVEGVVDIYLPDMKYGSDEAAKKYSDAADYVQTNRAAVREMFRQAGPLRTGEDGIAYRGLCVRHLVLPEEQAGTRAVLAYLAATYDPADIFMSLMAQYRPLYKASSFPEINRSLSHEEYEPLKKAFIEAGFGGFYQEIERLDEKFIINFDHRKSERLTGED